MYTRISLCVNLMTEQSVCLGGWELSKKEGIMMDSVVYMEKNSLQFVENSVHMG